MATETLLPLPGLADLLQSQAVELTYFSGSLFRVPRKEYRVRCIANHHEYPVSEASISLRLAVCCRCRLLDIHNKKRRRDQEDAATAAASAAAAAAETMSKMPRVARAATNELKNCLFTTLRRCLSTSGLAIKWSKYKWTDEEIKEIRSMVLSRCGVHRSPTHEGVLFLEGLTLTKKLVASHHARLTAILKRDHTAPEQEASLTVPMQNINNAKDALIAMIERVTPSAAPP
jgi:hypothetical protein